MSNEHQIQVLSAVEASLLAYDDTTACGCAHERRGKECSLDIQNRRIGCPHPERRVLSSALESLHDAGIIDRACFDNHWQALEEMDEELYSLDDLVASWARVTEHEQVASAQSVVIARKDGLRQAILLLIGLKRRQ